MKFGDLWWLMLVGCLQRYPDLLADHVEPVPGDGGERRHVILDRLVLLDLKKGIYYPV